MATLKIGYFVREAGTNLRRNKLMTMAAVLTAAVSLVLLGATLALGEFVGDITGDIERQVEVSVFLEEDITEEQQRDVYDTLVALPVVPADGVRYVSKEEAFEEFQEMYRDQPVLYENIPEDTLPASFRVQLSDPARVDLVRSRMEGNPAVEEVVDQRELVERLVRLTGLMRTFSGFMIVILLGAAVLLIANTIQLAIYSRRKQIEIMKLVGATNWFVRVPFMLEGIVAGVAGAGIAIVLLAVGKWAAREAMPPFIPTASLTGVPVGQAFVLLILGLSIGALGSFVAMRRFLDV